MTKNSSYYQLFATNLPARPQPLFQGAFIDSEGREVPITERMIQQACRELEAAASSVYSRIRNARAHRVSPQNRTVSPLHTPFSQGESPAPREYAGPSAAARRRR